jgi:hypothetical protein
MNAYLLESEQQQSNNPKLDDADEKKEQPTQREFIFSFCFLSCYLLRHMIFLLPTKQAKADMV